MAESLERFVGAAMDDAPLTKTHYGIFGLIAAGYFFDIADVVVYGALVPGLLKSHFMTPGQVALVGSATMFGLAIGAAGQGEFTDRFGRKTVYQFNLLLFGLATLAAAMSPNYVWLAVLRFLAGIGLGAEQPLCYAYAGEYAPKRIRGRILAGIHFIGGACPWPISTLFVLFFAGALGWRGVYATIGVGALTVFVLRFALPESPRWLVTHGKGQKAVDILGRMKLPVPSAEQNLVAESTNVAVKDPLLIVLRKYPLRVVAGMVCFVAFFGVAVGLSVWLPNLMNQTRGMTITKSLTYTLGMNFAVPCASAFMMFAIERFGRKKLSMISYVLSGLCAVLFVHTSTSTALLIAGFWMIFFLQLAGNTMQIMASEVFPTSSRATGFGLASGVGRLGAAFIIPAILWIQNGYGTNAVFAAVAATLGIAAAFVMLLGPEACGKALEELVKRDDVAEPKEIAVAADR